MNDQIHSRKKSPPWHRHRFIVVLSAILALVVLPIYSVKVFQKYDYTDFSVYYLAAARAKAMAWDRIYSLLDGTSPYRYAPVILPFFRPFAELSPLVARMTWFYLQYLFFAGGFYFIYLTLLSVLHREQKGNAKWITCFSFLFILRFCLDTFTIGQVSSLMFLGFCVGLYGWVNRRPGWAGVGLFIPTVFKIGPGFIYGLFSLARTRERMKAISAPLVFFMVLLLIQLAWIGSYSVTRKLWSNWAQIVINDSVYYDASHYGSQSIKSALLRAVNHGWITMNHALSVYLACAVLGCAGVLGFWFFRRPKTYRARGLFYALGIFIYLWVMPETFKYGLTTLAIPVALILSAKKTTHFETASIVFGVFTLSLAGLDIVRETVFFSLQKASVPLFATFFLAAAVVLQAIRESEESARSKSFRSLLGALNAKLGPWTSDLAKPLDLDFSLIIPMPCQTSIKLNSGVIRQAFVALFEELSAGSSKKFEILLVPFGNRISLEHPLFQEAQNLVVKYPDHVKLITNNQNENGGPDGRGSAFRCGFLLARGKIILLSQIEQPVDPKFFISALKNLSQGFDLVRANRRMAESRFKIPVRVLRLVYGRHRLGLLFNHVVRIFLPISTTDTHSATLGMSRALASHVFTVQTSADFLFDLELNLAAHASHAKEKDLPVTLLLAEEKSFNRVTRESLMIFFGLPLLALRYRRGYYRPVAKTAFLKNGITADDWGISPGVNQGILELARLGVVKRVSIMANCAHVQHGLSELTALPGIEYGLHFNLTYGRSQVAREKSDPIFKTRLIQDNGLYVTSPGRFILNWLKPGHKKCKLNYVQTELTHQLGVLSRLKVNVQYMDGHHHIHLTPGLIQALSQILQADQIKHIRLTYDAQLWLSPKFLLNLLSLFARTQLKRFHFESLPCFYPDFTYFKDQGRLRSRLARVAPKEVIVHPARVNDLGLLEFPDSYAQDRVTEFLALRMLGQTEV